MKYTFSADGWEDYKSWQDDKKSLKRINKLIEEATRTPFEGTGKPEPLKHELSGYWSRRINQTDRLVYKTTDDQILIAACAKHYSKK